MPNVAALWALGLFVAGVRFWFSENRHFFHMAPDEPAQLAMARWISGGTRWNMFDSSSWRPGMAVLMAPLFWFTDDWELITHGGLLICAALGGVGAVLLARLATRLTRLSPTMCILFSAAIALAPASLSATAFVWAEALVTVTFLGCVTLVLRFYDEPRLMTGVWATVVAACGLTSHSRLMPLVPTVAVLLIFRCALDRAWMRAVLLAISAAVTTALSFAFAQVVYSAVWDDPASTNTVGTIIKRLPKLDDNGRSAVGQIWYQLAATAGLTAIGAGVLVIRSLRRRRERGSEHAVVTRDARLLVLMVAPLVLASIVFMSGRTRTDHRIYGRYNDAVLWPVLIIALAWLVQLRTNPARKRAAAGLLAVAAAIVGAGFAIHAVAGKALHDSAGVKAMIAGLIPLTTKANTIDIVDVSQISLAVLLILVMAALLTRRPIVLPVVLAGLLSFAAVRTHDGMGTRLNSWEVSTAVTAIEDIVPAGTPLGIRFVREKDKPGVSWDDQRRRAQIYQFALPDHEFIRDRGTDDSVGPYVFAPVNDKLMKAAGAEILWRDPSVQYALWLEPVEP
jgi:hypothetical protein